MFPELCIAIFYYIPSIRERLNLCINSSMASPIVLALTEFFNQMSDSFSSVLTSPYFESLKGTYNWICGRQQDSNEFVINVLQDLYTQKNASGMNTGDLILHCPFNITIQTLSTCIMD